MNLNQMPMRCLVMDSRTAYFEITYQDRAGKIQVTPMTANSSRAAWRTFTILGFGLFLDIREVSLEAFTRLNAEALFTRTARRFAC